MRRRDGTVTEGDFVGLKAALVWFFNGRYLRIYKSKWGKFLKGICKTCALHYR